MAVGAVVKSGHHVVGPSFGDADSGDISVWHINPLGAGGMRISF